VELDSIGALQGGAEPAGEAAAFLRDVLRGLSAHPRSLPCVWFYDEAGSLLFQRIAELPEYYLTRCEREILERHGAALVAPLAGRPCTVVDLGAGDGHKTGLLLAELRPRVPALRYAPVDLSPAALAEASARVVREWPDVEVAPLAADYARALGLLRAAGTEGSLLVLFLGSNVGNLDRERATAFFAGLRRELRPDDRLLCGFDLVKDPAILLPAYDDPGGVTAAFNLNLLARMNRELSADFDLAGFRHRATFDPGRAALDSWLLSLRRQEVHLAGRTFRFEEGETIHTEVACKYTPADVSRFAREAGFEEELERRDRRGWFLDALWRVAG
jgi:dimethylhistidine N-methyltransferase